MIKKLLFILSLSFIFSNVSFAGNIGNDIYGLYSETYEGVVYDVRFVTNNVTDGVWMGVRDRLTSNPYGFSGLGEGGDSDNLFENWPASTTCGSYDVTRATEGSKCIRASVFGIMYSTVPYPAKTNWKGRWDVRFAYKDAGGLLIEQPTDMTAYTGGTLEFDIKISTEIYVEIAWKESPGYYYCSTIAVHQDLGVPLTQGLAGNSTGGSNNWTHISLPISSFTSVLKDTFGTTSGEPESTGLNMSSITCPVAFRNVFQSSKGTWWVDNVYWKKAGLVAVSSITVKNIGTNQTTNYINWSGMTAGSTKWKTSNQYVQLDLKGLTGKWGIQIFTDNTDSGANPKWVTNGNPTNNPAGLVGYATGVSTSSYCLPMCWRIVTSTSLIVTDIMQIDQVITSTCTRGILYSVALGSGYPCFLWMKDKATPNIPSANTTAFVNGEDYARVWDSTYGIQHAEGTWGVETSPNYIYFGADFTHSVTPYNYKTNRLIIEIFNE